MVELEPVGGAAEGAVRHGPLAAALVAPPHLAADVRRDVARVGSDGCGRPPGPADDALPPVGLAQDEVEARLQGVPGRGAGPGVGQGIAGGLELLEELPGDGEVEAGKGLGQGLGWQDQMRLDWPWARLWAAPEVEPERLVSVAGLCRLVWSQYQRSRTFPYAIRFAQTTFTPEGKLSLGPGAKGLTCSTFVLAVFNGAGLTLVDEASWPVRKEDDRNLIAFLRTVAPAPHVDILSAEVESGVRRVKPEEVVGACACSPLPAGFQPCAQAGGRVVQKLGPAPGAAGP